jgi:hypothetical protein
MCQIAAPRSDTRRKCLKEELRVVLVWKQKRRIAPNVGRCPWTRPAGTSIPQVASCRRRSVFHGAASGFLPSLVKGSWLLPAMMLWVKPQGRSRSRRGCETNQESRVRGVFGRSIPTRSKAAFNRENRTMNTSAFLVW